MVPFAIFFAMIPYLFWLRSSGDPRAQDLKIEGSEMSTFESLMLTLSLFGIIFFWARSLWRSFRARQFGWFVAVLLAWPAAAIYVWREES